MTPNEKNIVKSLIAFAWADGKFDDPESDIVDAMLTGFDATDAEQKELEGWGKTKRTLGDIPLGALNAEDRELLLSNAAVLTRADGVQAETEKKLLDELASLLGFDAETTKRIIDTSADGALQLKSSALSLEAPVKPPPVPPRSRKS